MALSKKRKFDRVNHFPPTSSKPELLHKEQWFTLDCVAMDKISKDYSQSSPKLGSVIPPYEAQRDPHAAAYFSSKPVLPLIQKMGWVNRRASSYERLVDHFQHRGDAALYLLNRNKAGAGHSIAQVRGHQLYLSSVKPVLGYNGAYGYRRNTPSLRRRPSSFGILTKLPIY
ncbi:sperm microtubule associated protein 1-like [Tiliqua scincoides]|uniref:sperm microtubule associated protein 1-like n=1 Tax=Tiliqua scincoides TaxID=71010 RepID=UPI0034619453